MGNNYKPKVSIIVPVYNMGDKIDNSIESLKNQDYSNIEIILVDDGSTDDSFAHCKELQKTDIRIKVIHTENRGSGPARNTGVENSTGEYLYFPDADDFVDPRTISHMVSAAITTNSDLVLCGYQYVDSSGKTLSKNEYKPSTVSGNTIRNNYAYYKVNCPDYGICGAPWNKLFSASVAKENHIVFPPLRRHQDEAFIARYLCVCQQATFINEMLYTYYCNNQADEWRKYPVDYIDSVNGLYDDRTKNVLLWNPNDMDTREMIHNELICNTIKALELSFSPKFDFSIKKRKAWIQKTIANSAICDIDNPRMMGIYQRVIMFFIRHEYRTLLYSALALKVKVLEIINK